MLIYRCVISWIYSLAFHFSKSLLSKGKKRMKAASQVRAENEHGTNLSHFENGFRLMIFGLQLFHKVQSTTVGKGMEAFRGAGGHGCGSPHLDGSGKQVWGRLALSLLCLGPFSFSLGHQPSEWWLMWIHSTFSLLRQHSVRMASKAFPEACLLGDSKFTETEPLHKALPSWCPLQCQSFCLCFPLNPHAQTDLSVFTDGHLSEILGAK